MQGEPFDLSMPKAIEDKAAVPVELDPAKTGRILAIVRAWDFV